MNNGGSILGAQSFWAPEIALHGCVCFPETSDELFTSCLAIGSTSWKNGTNPVQFTIYSWSVGHDLDMTAASTLIDAKENMLWILACKTEWDEIVCCQECNMIQSSDKISSQLLEITVPTGMSNLELGGWLDTNKMLLFLILSLLEEWNHLNKIGVWRFSTFFLGRDVNLTAGNC